MYAVIRTGGKQYTVKPGDRLQVEKLDQKLGAEFDISEVLLLGGEATLLGAPLVKNAKVTCVVTKQARTRKVIVFKKKRRHSFRKFKTHKQDFTEIFVKSITSPDGKVTKTEDAPNVVDMKATRIDKIEAKKAARIEANKPGASKEEAPVAKKAATKKKLAKKAAPKKKAAGAKKSSAKKTVKKTSKKA
jgi:large subunit ribosomal protein L21